ncbi:unnamed protein product [Allacma fusca]|uniref:C2H2-type domain-containing protein n=1 Tax=Allacma fusca TaxID=39272 RepID=A0A8J2P0Y9_9HEXA|nr:unnamed protein product [Allacma fusca]
MSRVCRNNATCVIPSPTLETAEMNTRAISVEALKAPEPIQRTITNEPDITWKARKRSRVLDIDVSEAAITLNMITGSVQPLTNDSTRLELFYSCQHCSFCSYDTSKFKDHILSRSPGTLFQCHLCTFKSCTSSGMRIHMGKIHSSLRINAKVVPKSVAQTIAVTAEAPEAETPPVSVQKSYRSIPKSKSGYQCAHCQKKFWKKVQFQHHLRTHTRERSFKCDRCSLSFYSQAKQTKHISSRRGTVQKCLYCELTFCFEMTLAKHMKTSHADEISNAPVLPVCLNDESMGGDQMVDEILDETLNYENIEGILPELKCLHCDSTFSNEQLFLQHNKDFHGDSSISNCNTSNGPHSAQKDSEEDSNNPKIKEKSTTRGSEKIDLTKQ